MQLLPELKIYTYFAIVQVQRQLLAGKSDTAADQV
jgi:hypothetical protein